MTVTLRFPAPPPVDCREAIWQRWVLDLAKRWGWRANHVYRAKLSDGTWRTTCSVGWPDLTLVRGARIVFAEVKDDKRQPDPAQDAWLDALADVPCAEVFVWRPRHWQEVVRTLAPDGRDVAVHPSFDTGT